MSSLGFVGILVRQRSPARRAATWAFALIVPPLIAAATEPARASLGLSGYFTIALLVVVVVALMGGLRPALLAVLASWLAGDYVFATPYNTFRIYLRAGNAPLAAFILVGAAVGLLVDQLAQLLEEQTRLRLELSPRARGSSRPPTRPAGASSAICTTAPSSGWSHSGSSCAPR